MKSTYRIPEYYFAQVFISYLLLMMLTILFEFMLMHISLFHEYFEIGLAITVGIIGLGLIGYLNAYRTQGKVSLKPIYVHIFLVLIFFISSVLWSNIDIFTILFRNIAYFICLQFGVTVYKWTHNKHLAA